MTTIDRGHLAALETPLPPDPIDHEPDTPASELGSTWGDVSLSDVIAAVSAGTYERPMPDVLQIQGAGALLYRGRVHGVHGIGGAGKTWLSGIALAERINRGEHVVFVDLEDTPATLVERLILDLRCDPAAVLKLLHYKAPAEPSQHGVSQLHTAVLEHDAALVVLDSVGEGLANDNVKQNEDDEVARWMRRVARSVADLGPAVLLIDHVPKTDETTLMPIGSQRKQAAMNGAIYSVQVKVPFSRDAAGKAHIVCGKDRLGTYKRGEVVAEMHVTPRGDGSSDVALLAHASSTTATGGFRPTNLMEKISRFIESNPGASTNAIRSGVNGKNDFKDQALAALIEEEYVTTADGPRRSILHTATRRFREADDDGAQSTGYIDRDRARALREGHGAQSTHRARGTVGARSGTVARSHCPLHPDNPRPDACDTCEHNAREAS